ncbi:MAG: hypothetical protein KDD62_00085 [Bdellovibrionales bacterium]|nr:hypothetical protein [Bdellovibrionales bacterium]
MAGEGQLARSVRTGLEQDLSFEEQTYTIVEEKENTYLDERSHGKTARQHVKEFGALFGLISLLFIGWCIHKHVNYFWWGIGTASAVFFIATGYKAPAVLYPLWKSWMGIAHVMGMVMTFFILSICWTIVLAPMALLLKIVGKAVMDTTFDRSVKTYWEDRHEKKHDFQLLENQY